MAQSSVVYYPKLDGLDKDLDGLQSEAQANAYIVTVEPSSTDQDSSEIYATTVEVSAATQMNGQSKVQAQEQRYRVLIFNWTNEVYQTCADIAVWLGLIISVLFFTLGQFSTVLDNVIWSWSLTYGPLLHIVTCLFLLVGIHYKKPRFYTIYFVLNSFMLAFFYLFAFLLILDAGNHHWNQVMLVFAILHLLLSFPHLLTIMIVRTAGDLMQLKPLANVGVINGKI